MNVIDYWVAFCFAVVRLIRLMSLIEIENRSTWLTFLMTSPAAETVNTKLTFLNDALKLFVKFCVRHFVVGAFNLRLPFFFPFQIV